MVFFIALFHVVIKSDGFVKHCPFSVCWGTSCCERERTVAGSESELTQHIRQRNITSLRPEKRCGGIAHEASGAAS
jgi:hypothetical protein